MKDRIRQIMEDQHLTQQSFAQMTQISTPTLSNILTGKSRATLNTVELIKRKFPLISLDWLLYGVGPMYIHDGAAPPHRMQLLVAVRLRVMSPRIWHSIFRTTILLRLRLPLSRLLLPLCRLILPRSHLRLILQVRFLINLQVIV